MALQHLAFKALTSPSMHSSTRELYETLVIILVILMRLLPISLTVGVLSSLDMVRKLGWCSADRGMKWMGNLGTRADRVCMDMD